MPVLSKQLKLTTPPVITLDSSMQKIDLFFNFSIAYITPKAILTGKAGGTVITIRSKNLMKMSKGATTLLRWFIIPKYVKMATKNKKNKNFADYL